MDDVFLRYDEVPLREVPAGSPLEQMLEPSGGTQGSDGPGIGGAGADASPRTAVWWDPARGGRIGGNKAARGHVNAQAYVLVISWRTGCRTVVDVYAGVEAAADDERIVGHGGEAQAWFGYAEEW